MGMLGVLKHYRDTLVRVRVLVGAAVLCCSCVCGPFAQAGTAARKPSSVASEAAWQEKLRSETEGTYGAGLNDGTSDGDAHTKFAQVGV